MSKVTKEYMTNHPEARKNLSEINKGKKQSPETIAKRVAKIKGQQRSPRLKKNCAFCGKELLLTESEKNRKFCSLECKGKWQSENSVGEKSANWHGGDIIKKCEECDKEFSVEQNRMKTARFCSQHCKGVWLAKKGLLPKPPVMFGENHPQWKGGDVIKKCEECGRSLMLSEHERRISSELVQGSGVRKILSVKKIPLGVGSLEPAKNVGTCFSLKHEGRILEDFALELVVPNLNQL